VLSDLFSKETGVSWQGGGILHASAYLSREVIDWAGFSSEQVKWLGGNHADLIIKHNQTCSIAELNDKSRDFKEAIAIITDQF
jgi:hypothetical protein